MFVGGDVFANQPDGRSAFRSLSPLLRTADLVMANCEGVYTDRPSPAPSHKHLMVASPERGSMLGEAPFHVLGCANNHMMDGGYEGLSDTLETLRSQGIATVGAGLDLDEALRPVVLERQGVRFAVLAFASVFPVGYEARQARPGIAPLRVQTFYANPDPNFWEPGVEPLISTVPFPPDRARFRTAIAEARELADVLVVLPHWGYSGRLEKLHDYEIELARDAVDHGADIVLCCHHHSLRGIEFHRGRPIFYGLGSLVHHLRSSYQLSAEEVARGRGKVHQSDDAFPFFPLHPDARMTGLATLDVDAGGSRQVGFVPAQIQPDGSTEPLRAADPRATTVAEYLARITSESGFGTGFKLTERDGWAWVSVTENGQEIP
jgi:poly-gamma-glutamate synthesis protein (capsule biosynthesis protein)